MHYDYTNQKKNNQLLFFFFFTVLIDYIGFGIILPVLPQLIESLEHTNPLRAARLGSYLIFIYALVLFICAPIIGSLSDAYGRRKILLLSIAGFCIDYLLMGFAPSYWWLLLGRGIAGIAGATYAIVASAATDLANKTNKENKAKYLGIIGGAYGLGLFLGPLLGGILGNISIKLPFYVAAALAGINFIIGFFIMPETLAKEDQRKVDVKQWNMLGTLSFLKTKPYMISLLGLLLICIISFQTFHLTWFFYAPAILNFSILKTSSIYATISVGICVGQMVLLPYIRKYLSVNQSILVGLVSYAICYLCFTIFHSYWILFFSALILWPVGVVAFPCFLSFISNQLSNKEQGMFQVSYSTTTSLGLIIGPVLLNNAYAYCADKNSLIYFPTISFFMSFIFIVIAFLSFTYIIKKLKKVETTVQ
ncbi:MAG: MFS transporter [Phycisphaerales bacterium]|nr:MFS transporter [Phycisphaerales bacterium]